MRAVLWCAAVILGGYLSARGLLFLSAAVRGHEGEIWRQFHSCVQKCAEYYFFPGGAEGLLEEAGERLGAFFGGASGEGEAWNPDPEDGAAGDSEASLENQRELVREENRAFLEKNGAGASGDSEQAAEGGEGDAEDTAGDAKQAEDAAEAGSEAGARQSDEAADAEESGTGADADGALPAWTQAVETTPKMDLDMESLADFTYLRDHFFVVDPNTTTDGTQLNAQDFLDTDLSLPETEGGDAAEPVILIYHTHGQEGYADSDPQDPSTTVIGVGDYLASILQDVYGYPVLHLTDSFDLVDGQLDRSRAYNYALPALEAALKEHPSVEVIIDLHRDGVSDDKRLVTTVNGKPTAQIMYFNGLSRTVEDGDLDSLPNPYIRENLAFSFQLSWQAAHYYPDLTRCIYLKGYRYNLHLRPRSLLLEVGAQTNTVEEAKNAMEPFAVILDKVLKRE